MWKWLYESSYQYFGWLEAIRFNQYQKNVGHHVFILKNHCLLCDFLRLAIRNLLLRALRILHKLILQAVDKIRRVLRNDACFISVFIWPPLLGFGRHYPLGWGMLVKLEADYLRVSRAAVHGCITSSSHHFKGSTSSSVMFRLLDWNFSISWSSWLYNVLVHLSCWIETADFP